MAYFLPRAVIVLLGWGLTSGLIGIVLPGASTAAFCFAGLSWAAVGIVCFGYIRKLRREADIVAIRPADAGLIQAEPAE